MLAHFRRAVLLAVPTTACSTPSANPDATVADSAPIDSAVTADGGFDFTNPCIGAEHLLCDDFDPNRDGGYANFWVGPVVTDGATIQIRPSGAALSPPNVLFTGAIPNSSSHLEIHAAPFQNGLRCQLDVQVQRRGANSGWALQFEIGDLAYSGAYYRIELRLQAADSIVESGQYAGGAPIAAYETKIAQLETGRWIRFAAELGIGPKTHMLVKINGVTIATAPHADITKLPMSTHQMLLVGAWANDGPSAWEVLFDNMACDAL